MTLQGEVKRIFSGWMFASSPGLHAVEHSIYDVWLTDCKNPVIAVAAPVEPAPAPKPAAPAPAAHAADRAPALISRPHSRASSASACAPLTGR